MGWLLYFLLFGSVAFAEEIYDPFEPLNRSVLTFNQHVDRYFLNPVVKGYRVLVPEFFRGRIYSAVQNLSEPVIVFNALLQMNIEGANASFWRFAVNSSLGFAGTMDIANYAGLSRQPEDFGQTLGKYGIGAGPYLVLPLMGSSNTRDFVGLGVDIFTDPFNYIFEDELLAASIATGAIATKDAFFDLEQSLQADSFDYYASLRSIYQQRRISQIGSVRHVF